MKKHLHITGHGKAQLANPFFEAAGKFVTVEAINCQVYVGTLHVVDDSYLTVNSGLPGRPMLLHVDDVEEVLPVNASNPHVK